MVFSTVLSLVTSTCGKIFCISEADSLSLKTLWLSHHCFNLFKILEIQKILPLIVVATITHIVAIT